MVWEHAHDLSRLGEKGGLGNCFGSEITSFVESEMMGKVWELFALLHSTLKSQWVHYLKDCQHNERDSLI